MTNFELIPIPVPSTQQQAEAIERWLEECSKVDVELVSFMPSQYSSTVIAVMKAPERGRIPQPPRW